jgi:hypothetical protein
VTTRYAHKLFDKLVRKMKAGGLIVAFGHTLLIKKENYFRKCKLAILQNNGYDAKSDSIFQYYVLRYDSTN